MNCNGVKIAGGFILLLLVVTVGIGIPSFAATPPSVVPSEVVSQTVKGEVVMIAGDLQVVEDAAGKKEVHMTMDELYVVQDVGDEAVPLHVQVNDATKLKDTIEVGDKVEAQVAGDGYALSIKKTE